MVIKPLAAAAFLALSMGIVHPADASPIILDGTFQNPIGTGLNLTPWSDWTGAGIITHSAAPFGLPGNYASLPINGDLFQRFNMLPDGNYTLSFSVNNPSSNAAELVLAVQQALGTPVDIGITAGTLWVLDLPAFSGWIDETFYFKFNSNSFIANEFYFSNSYDAPVAGIENSINPVGTLIDVANVSLVTGFIEPSPPNRIPEPATWAMMLIGLLGFSFVVRCPHP